MDNFMTAKADRESNIQYSNNIVTGHHSHNTFVNHPSVPTALASASREKNYFDDETNVLSENLRRKYENIKLPTVPWMNEGNLLLRSCYADLKLVAEQRSISIEQIFDEITLSMQGEKQEPKRILISAPQGYGKTTLAYKIINDWAQQKEYMKRFKLACLINLRNLDKDVLSEIKDIAERCGIEKKDAVPVSMIIQENASSTLVILDALDELNPLARDDVHKVLLRSELSNVTVVTTCRTGGYEVIRKEDRNLREECEKSIKFQDRQITIEGLSRPMGDKLLGKLVQSPDKVGVVNRVREILDQRNEFDMCVLEDRQLLEWPLFLISLAFIVAEKPDVEIETKTDLYKYLTDFVIRRSCCKRGVLLPNDFTVFGTQDSWNYYRHEFYQFGKLSTKAIDDEDRGLHFDCNEKTKVMYDLDLLIKYCEVCAFSTKYYYKALNFNIMEFASAYALRLEYRNNDSVSKKETIRKIVLLYIDYESSSLVIPFLFGLFSDEMSCLVDDLIRYSIAFNKTNDTARYFTDCKSVQYLPDEFSVLFPKVIDSSDWLVQTKLFKKLLPCKTLKFGVGAITGKDFVNLSQSVDEAEYLKIDIDSQCKCDVPVDFNYSKIRCKKLKFTIRPQVNNVEMWLKIFNSITARDAKKLQFADDCKFLYTSEINDLLAIATERPVANCRIILESNNVRHVTSYTNLSEVSIYWFNQMGPNSEEILSAMSASADLQRVCICGYDHDLDISLLTNSGKKQWESVTLEQVKTVKCSSELVNCNCISSFRNISCTNSSAVFGSVIPDLLHCDDGYITQALESSSFLTRWPSVKELILQIPIFGINYTEVISCLTRLCRKHSPTIRLRLLDFPQDCKKKLDCKGRDCVGFYNEHAVIDFLKSFSVTEVYCGWSQHSRYHSKTCLFQTLARTVHAQQISLDTLIITYCDKECISDSCSCLSGSNVAKIIVILDSENSPDLGVDVVNQLDFTTFKIQNGYVSDFCPKVSHLCEMDNECICISLL